MIVIDDLTILERGQQDAMPIVQLIDTEGNPMNYADVLDLVIFVLVNNQIQAKYSKVAATGFLPITAVSGQPTQASFIIARTQTQNWNTGILAFKIQYVQTHADFPGGKATTKTTQPLYNVV